MRESVSYRQLGHFEWAGVPIKRKLAEFKVTEDALLPVGTMLTAAHFSPGQYVDVQGTYLFTPTFSDIVLLVHEHHD